jgi:hypothetical protein
MPVLRLQANFADEIANAISSPLSPLYGAGCQIVRRELVGSLIFVSARAWNFR